mmetsp:Transcript_46062/g.115553  ORF Transcript_46062/g.115553 Transcript_46062/m.115553 type:complete len:122 (+) Transcript_46062:1607-1972(+)
MNAFVSTIRYVKLKNFQSYFSTEKTINNPNYVFFPIKTTKKSFSQIRMQENENNISEKKSTILDFFQEVNDEIKMIEWPTLDRVLKQFVIVVISLVFSALFIFSIDGLFAAGNKILFEGNL